MVYSYKHGFSGFAAKLTESEAKKIAGNSNMSNYFQTYYQHKAQCMYMCVCIKIGEFQSCLASFGSYQIASTGYKQLGVGISLASLMNLIPIFFTTAAMVMESLQASLTRVCLHSLLSIGHGCYPLLVPATVPQAKGWAH